MDGQALLEGQLAARAGAARREAVTEARIAQLFDRHRERLYRLALRLTRNVDAAHDLVQDTFLRAARRVRSIPAGEGPAEAWLVRVLVNRCRDLGRRRAVRQRPLPEPEREPVADPERTAVARATVDAALGQLSPKRRAVVVMRELEELPAREIGRLLGMRPATVRWHLSRARGELRALLLEPGVTGKERA